ncbi:hypothetical protein [Microtetraspora niveoalba]|uniref:hypothetical protein n=1 Tax=Microtetraspora niveoalba TaxID=46175 RepID=UPI0035716ECC
MDLEGQQEHQGLQNLHQQHPCEAAPPQPGDAFGLGQRVTQQRERSADDQEQQQGDADDGDEGQDQAHQHAASGEQHQIKRGIDRIGEDGGDLAGQQVPGPLRVHAFPDQAAGQAVGELDGVLADGQRPVGQDRRQHQPRGDLLDGGGGLRAAVGHDDDAAREDEQHEQGVGDDHHLAGQLPHPGQQRRRR